ncbi:Crotonobetainyl-CoA reductase [Streptomyces alboniger]
MSDELAALVSAEAGDRAAEWDLAGAIPPDVLRGLGAKGALCAEVPAEYGGHGLTGRANGELTAHAGALCSSLRSVMTSQGMAAWTIQRFGTRRQRTEELTRLTSGGLAAVAFSEPQAGSDLSAIATTIVDDGDKVVLNGHKVWSTAAAYADVVIVFGRYQDGAAAVVVPTDAPGVTVRPVAQPLGCRAAGHADVDLDNVRLPAGRVLSGASQSPGLLTTIALTYGRLSVAWGCVGIIRGCLRAAATHARHREQFGKPLAHTSSSPGTCRSCWSPSRPRHGCRGLARDAEHEGLVASLVRRGGPLGAIGVLRGAVRAHAARPSAGGCLRVRRRCAWLAARRRAVLLTAGFRRTERNRMMEVAYRFAGFREHTEGAAEEGGVQTLAMEPVRQDAPAHLAVLAPRLFDASPGLVEWAHAE